jgi:peptidoglycan/xylan/chitin deacetylase (PgdA/CDA1 family)
MSAFKRKILSAAKAAGLFALARRRSAPAVRILCYHGIWLGDPIFPGDSMFMLATTFRRRLQFLRRAGYPVVSLADAAAALNGSGPKLPPCAVVITIDDGWLSTYQEMLPPLIEYGMPATLYCDTAQLTSGRIIAHVMARYVQKVANKFPALQRRQDIDIAAATVARRIAMDFKSPADERVSAAAQLASALGVDLRAMLDARTFEYMTPDELRTAKARGLDIQLHTHRHTLGDMSAAVIEDEIQCNRQALAELLGMAAADFKHFCYPSGLTSATAATTLANIGMTTSVTTIQGLAWPGAPLQLLPRLHDGENVSDLEFEAELSGFSDWLRQRVRSAQSLLPLPVRPEVTTTGKLRFANPLMRKQKDAVPPF